MNNDALRRQMLFEANRKSAGVAFLLWFFLGGFGAHRFYLGKTGTGIAQLMLLLLGWLPLLLGWIALAVWVFVDLFLVSGMVRDENVKLAYQFGSDPAGGYPGAGYPGGIHGGEITPPSRLEKHYD